ncbi:hypothetical protein JHK82_050948 [Glycine max]|uniref:Uncharacterized protein n=1 Tax=Glycine max TaxID=3847 RepID=K7MTA7_SOYBN|nr:hypothetical protein JHK86_050804 [Glycine max]KAG4936728.1 hypothetical protein JHK85_051647 [Glycine max]KAG5092170.1 hypothetical protein JHK82_050948 [Glycine max]KAG5095252.1 hypothetical protein JHK84_050840 [Glycine max]KAH1155135.1 hypothetical protein GYH30_050440 [Glycine max]
MSFSHPHRRVAAIEPSSPSHMSLCAHQLWWLWNCPMLKRKWRDTKCVGRRLLWAWVICPCGCYSCHTEPMWKLQGEKL